jgi:glycosyltransferase involved in cell wall biosynthesis
MISAVVLTKNNEKVVLKCLNSILWCKEIIVVDDYSQDQTKILAKKTGAKVFLRHLNKDFSSQRNFGLLKAKHQWILFIDSDEQVPKKLADEIIEKIKNKDNRISGYFLKRQDKFLGRWLKFGETNKVKLLRLGQKKAGKWLGKVHETWEIKGKTKNLKYKILHQRNISISDFLKRINTYSSLRAQMLFDQGVKFKFWQLLIFPQAKFIKNYFFCFGFRDGIPGLAMAIFMSFHSFLVRVKLYFLYKYGNKIL